MTLPEAIHVLLLVALVIAGFFVCPIYTVTLVIVAWSDR